jgi:F-type H+-transporting ATPase subunit epsilon
MRLFPLTIASVDTTHFEGDVVSVTCPGKEGEVTILKNHVPFVTTLKLGTITARTADTEKHIPVSHGILEVHTGGVTILL